VFKQDRINQNRKTILKFMRQLRTHVGYLIQDKKFRPKDLYKIGQTKSTETSQETSDFKPKFQQSSSKQTGQLE